MTAPQQLPVIKLQVKDRDEPGEEVTFTMNKAALRDFRHALNRAFNCAWGELDKDWKQVCAFVDERIAAQDAADKARSEA